MKLFLIIGGFCIIIFMCLIPLKRKLTEYHIEKNGQIVTGTITYVPHCLGSKIMYFMKFNYQGQIFDKKVGCGFDEKHKIGDLILFKHIEGIDIFLFEDEKIEKEFIASGLLGIVGLFFIIYGFKRK